MTDYKELRIHCRKTHQLISSVIEDFLIIYAAGKEKLHKKAERKLARYSHISREFPEYWSNMAMAQHIAHQIFRKNGHIKRYIHHSELDQLPAQDMSFLEFQASHPWRFSFSKITDRPDSDFFEMKDVFTDEPYLLYSPALTSIMMTEKVNLCFNLIGFNGECWHTFGPVNTYRCFELQDILFFATQLNRGGWIENGRELMELVDEDPVPFMHLIRGATYPRAFHIDDQIYEIKSEYLDDSFDADVFRGRFKIEYNQGVYQLSLRGWGQFPHYTAAYYNEDEKLLLLYSMTERGFNYLVRQLNACGYELDNKQEVRVNIGMLKTASDILKKDFNLNPYSSIFSTESPEEGAKETSKIDMLLNAMITFIYTGQDVDFEGMSLTYDVSLEKVKELHKHYQNKLN